MVICIEPMLNLGTDDSYEEDDGWTIRTEDGKCILNKTFESGKTIG